MYPRPDITTQSAAKENMWTNRTMPKTTIVCHTMGGYFDGTRGWFNNPAAMASSNFGIAQDGRADMYVDPQGPGSPYANGGINNPDQEFLDLYARNGKQNANFWTISIEHEDKTAYLVQITDFPSMFEKSTMVAAWLCSLYGLDPNAPGTFLGHYQIDSVNRPHCPGWTASTWTSYVNEVSRKLSGTIVPVVVQLTTEQRLDRVEKLLAANGINPNFIPDDKGGYAPDASKWVTGEEAIAKLAADGDSAFQAIFELGFNLGRHLSP